MLSEMKLYVALLISALIVGCEPATKPTEKIEKNRNRKLQQMKTKYQLLQNRC